MEYCDFASIMSIVRGDLIEGSFSNQMELVDKLFSAYIDNCEDGAFFDEGQVSKWFSGRLKVSPAISHFYATDEDARDQLAVTFEDEIFPNLSDEAMVVDKVYELLLQDPSISENKKQKFGELHADVGSVFLAEALSFGMARPFRARDIRKPEKNQNAGKSPRILDYIIGADAPKPCRNFCGREKELERLHEIIEKDGKVFLHGIPGIGKSEVAKAYAKKHKKEYTNILYFIYSGSLKRDIASLQFADDKENESEDELFRRHNRFLRTLKPDTLLIIDNFNTTTTRDELLSVVLKYPCRILFTTKSNFADHSQLTVEEIEDHSVLHDLFGRYFKEAEKYRPMVEEIMEIVHYHTLSIELAARLLQSGMLTPEEVLAKLREERAAFDGTDTIRITKDGETKQATYYNHIETLFALIHLNQQQSYAMQCMSMMPLAGIESRLFAKWIGFTDLNTVNELVELGFIHGDDDRMISLHPMMQDVTIADLKPSVISCQTMLVKIGMFCHTYGRNVPHDRLIRQITENTIRYMEKNDCSWYVRFLEHVQASLPDCSTDSTPSAILSELQRLCTDESIGTPEDRAALLHFRALRQESLDDAMALFKEAISIYPKPSAENAKELYTLYFELADLYRRKREIDEASKNLRTALDLAKQYDPEYEQNIDLFMTVASYFNDTERFEQARDFLVPIEERLRKTNPISYEYAEVLKKLAVVTANLGNTQRGLALLDQSFQIYEKLCGDNEEMLAFHKNNVIERIRARIISAQNTPDRFVGAP